MGCAAIRYKAFSINAIQSSQGVKGSPSGFLTTAKGMAMRLASNPRTPRSKPADSPTFALPLCPPARMHVLQDALETKGSLLETKASFPF